MKKIIILIFAVAVIVVGATYTLLRPKFQSRHIYYEMISETAPQPLAVVRADDKTEGFIEDVQANWVRFSSNTNVFSITLSAIGLDPCVSNLIKFFNYRPQRFFLSEAEMIIGERQALLLPGPPIDGSIHVSVDDQTALVRTHTNAVTIYMNEDGTLRESVYFHFDDEEKEQKARELIGKRPELNQ